MKEDELLRWMKDEGVIEVRRITRMENGSKVNTPSPSKERLYQTISRLALCEIKTRLYVPNPTICYSCYQYGHTKLRCKSAAICRNCSKVHDLTSECNAILPALPRQAWTH